jgi:hypothetical protein
VLSFSVNSIGNLPVNLCNRIVSGNNEWGACTMKWVQVLNQIVFELPPEHPLADIRPLREFLGHTPPQVSFSFHGVF